MEELEKDVLVDTGTKKEKVKKEKVKKAQPEETLYNSLREKFNDMHTAKNAVYYVSIVLLNIAVMVLAMLWLNNKYEVVSFTAIKENLDFTIILLMCCVFVLVKMVQTVSLFISYHFKSKSNSFGRIYVANAYSDFYGNMTMFSNGRMAAMVGGLSNTKIKPQHIVSVAYEKKYFNLFTLLCVSAVMVLVGAFKWEQILHVSVTIICFIAIICGFMYLLYIRMTRSDKERSLSICSWIATMMSKLRLSGDFEKTYFGLVDKSLVTTKAVRVKWKAKVLNIVSSLVVILLRALIVYLIFSSLGLNTSEYYFKSLWILLVLDIMMLVWPFPRGVVLVDILVVSIISKMLFPEYIWYVLVFYKLFENIIYDVHYLIVLIVDKIANKIRAKKLENKLEK